MKTLIREQVQPLPDAILEIRELLSITKTALPSNRRTMMQEPSIESSGNVFTDLGFDPAEAAILQLRSRLINDLRGFINAKQLTQAQAVEQLGIAQSRVSHFNAW
ncbi:MAG: hypothetical protein RLZZ156_118 [Deinococcota bacterium]|jgi:predicted XRE-type DNA-binding protein